MVSCQNPQLHFPLGANLVAGPLTAAGPAKHCPRAVGPKPELQIASVQFQRVHHLLDNEHILMSGGKRFDTPEFTVNSGGRPVSLTSGERLKLTVGAFFNNAGTAPIMATLVGSGNGLKFRERASFESGFNEVEVRSDHKLPRGASVSDLKIDWHIEGPNIVASSAVALCRGQIIAGAVTSQNELLLTLGDPAESLGKSDLTYSRLKYSITRHVADILKLVGVAGKARAVLIYPKLKPNIKTTPFPGVSGAMRMKTEATKKDFIAVAEIPSSTGTDGGLNSPLLIHPTENWSVVLFDRSGGQNAFEGTIKFTADGRTRYYAGGATAPKFKTVGHVLRGMFETLSYAEATQTLVPGKGGNLIEKVVMTPMKDIIKY